MEIFLFAEPLDKRDIFVVGTKVRELALKYDFRNRNYESVEDELSESEKESPSFLRKLWMFLSQIIIRLFINFFTETVESEV